MRFTKFRKKPIVIEAVQWLGRPSLDEVTVFLTGVDALFCNPKDANGHIQLPTPEGIMIVGMGDWIIKGMMGEFYPCKPDIFEATYEKVIDGQ